MIKNKIILNIISKIIVLSFVISFSQSVFVLQTEAAAKLDWSNPNKDGKNPYKINTDAILNPSNLVQAVGCTGIVDKVTSFTTDFLSTQADKLIKTIWKKKAKEEAQNKSCKAVKAAIANSLAGVMNTEYATSVVDKIDCKNLQNVSDFDLLTQAQQDAKKEAAANKREECFNGLAYTMAKNQLTSMARQTINWVNSGFNGDPMYVRNVTAFTNSMERNVLESGINILTNPETGSPYGNDFARTAILSYRYGRNFKTGADNFLYSLGSDLGNFITNPKSYYKFSNTGVYGPGYYGPSGEYQSVAEYNQESTKTAVEKAKEYNNIFSDDFSTGGWEGYWALTQRDQNNPLGFSLAVSQYLEDQRNEKKTQVRDELLTNNGFLSQKKCLLWQSYDEYEKPKIKGGSQSWNEKTYGTYELESILAKTDDACSRYGEDSDICMTAKEEEKAALSSQTPLADENIQDVGADGVFIFTQYQSGPNDKCIKEETVTPGSIIKDKLTTYINSPERQLELADTINESLNTLFTSLIENFRNEGLFGLSQDKYQYLDNNMGAVNSWTNTIIDTNNDGTPEETTNDGRYNTSSIDLTRDLGNTFIHTARTDLGAWNARTNVPELNTGLGPCVPGGDNNCTYPANVYYTVSVSGNTKLFNNGYSGWAVGDRAYWNGTEWQNWKKGVVDPIEKRGIIQIQKDYVVAVKDLLKVIPGIMPRMGELDYCIPGPNPYFQNNSGDTAGAFNEYAGSLQSIYKDGSFFKRDTTTFSIAKPGNNAYDDYMLIFKETPNVWNKVKTTLPWKSLNEIGINAQVKKDRAESRVQGAADELLNQIQNDIKVFYKEYDEKVFKGIYGTMTQEFNKNESTEVLTPNTRYLPMAQDGYNLTKDIVNYDQELATATEDYNTAIVQAESNTAKLNKIKSEVSKIILAAQDRRNIRLLEILGKIPDKCQNAKDSCTKDAQTCLDEYNACVQKETDSVRDITKVADFKKIYAKEIAEFENKYNSCLEQEEIAYYDTNDIMNDNYEESKERCSDRRDNDLDGLIDSKDPDCPNTGSVIIPTTRDDSGVCVMSNVTIDDASKIDYILTSDCNPIKSQGECESRYKITTIDGDDVNARCQWLYSSGGGSYSDYNYNTSDIPQGNDPADKPQENAAY